MKIPDETSEEQFEFEMMEMRQAVKGQRHASTKPPHGESMREHLSSDADIDEQTE